MARLEQEKRHDWKAALSSTNSPWVACGVDLGEGCLSSKLEGMPGLIDWSVHGQVSALLVRKKLLNGECCLIPGNPRQNRPSFLFFSNSSMAGAQAFLEKARKLKITEIALAESTFPEDFLAKVKQTFKKEGVRCTQLEPKS